ncbi:MAG: c-type cytochrome [Bacteroidota bacterium]
MSRRLAGPGALFLCFAIVLMATTSRDDEGPPDLTLPDGFKAEVVYHPMGADSSSWVALAWDDRGRLLASDQYGSLYRLTPPPIGTPYDETVAEKLPINLGHAQGMLWAHNSLYVNVSTEHGIDGNGSGLYRVRDTTGDGELDAVTLLQKFDNWGEHGPHAIVMGPDGETMYMVAGNYVSIPEGATARGPMNWDEDGLFPVILDPRGHANELRAPGGWIARFDSLGQNFEVVATGFRNTFDFGFTPQGDILAFDSDMEWDMGMPWYRPIRVLHATSGADFGWRTGSGKWSARYPDTLPSVVDVGQGSPTGVLMGYQSGFPQRYQRGMFVFDWSFGTIYFVDVEDAGSSYTGSTEEFLAGVPLPLTDGLFGDDGALYFATGGRRLNSYVFRIYYDGDEATTPVAAAPPNDLNLLRRTIEAFHNTTNPAAVETVWPYLNHADRHIRYAARIAIEHQPAETWAERALAEPDAVSRIHAIVALARQGDADHRDAALEALNAIDFGSLTTDQQTDLLRAYHLVLIRMGMPSTPVGDAVIATLSPHLPSPMYDHNRDLGRVLAYLGAPNVAPVLVQLMQEAATPEDIFISEDVLARSEKYGDSIARMKNNLPSPQEIEFARILGHVDTGWTPELRDTYFQWFYDALNRKGGLSYKGFVDAIRQRAIERLPEDEKERLGALAGTFSVEAVDFTNLPQPEGPGKDYLQSDLNEMLWQRFGAPRNFERGQQMYAAALCEACHAMNGVGGNAGPDLTQVGTRFSKIDIARAIVNPSDAISDQYGATLIKTHDGMALAGRVVSTTDETVTISLNPYVPDQTMDFATADIAEQSDSPISLMPAKLLNRLNEQEVLDLMAYLISGGDPEHKCYTGNRGCDTED